MSKFLKAIDIIIFILALLAGAALVVPPLVGIDAIVIEKDASSNVQIGSVVYSETVMSDQLAVADQIVVTGDNDAVNLYTVNSYDADQHIVKASKDGSEEETIDVGTYVSKAMFVVPFLGLLKIATESMTGLLILGGCVMVWIILMILSIVLRKDDDDDDDDDDEEEYFKSLSQSTDEINLRMEADARGKEFPVDGEGDDFIKNLKGEVSGRGTESYLNMKTQLPPEVLAENEVGSQKASEKQEEKPVEADKEEKVQEMSSDETETSDEPKVARAVPEEKDMGTGELPDVQAALEAALENQQISYSRQKKNAPVKEVQEEQTIATGEIELAMPSYTAEEIISKAKAEGYQPKVRKDKGTDITLVDFSDLI